METRYVTLLKGFNQGSDKRAWQVDEMQYLGYALKKAGAHCLTCWDHHYPDVFVLVKSDIFEQIVCAMAPLDVRYSIIDIDMESTVQDPSINMVREICYPVFGPYTRTSGT